jgi:hypothetical protein
LIRVNGSAVVSLIGGLMPIKWSSRLRIAVLGSWWPRAMGPSPGSRYGGGNDRRAVGGRYGSPQYAGQADGASVESNPAQLSPEVALMELLTREQILQMEPEALIAAAECHGIEVEGLTPDQV